MILHSFSATLGFLLPNEKRYGHAVFGKILKIKSRLQRFWSHCQITYSFAQKLQYLKVIGTFSVISGAKFKKIPKNRDFGL